MRTTITYVRRLDGGPQRGYFGMTFMCFCLLLGRISQNVTWLEFLKLAKSCTLYKMRVKWFQWKAARPKKIATKNQIKIISLADDNI